MTDCSHSFRDTKNCVNCGVPYWALKRINELERKLDLAKAVINAMSAGTRQDKQDIEELEKSLEWVKELSK